MASYGSASGSGGYARPSRATSSTPTRSTGGVSPARLLQKSGAQHSFGGYAKFARPDGTFTMRKTRK